MASKEHTTLEVAGQEVRLSSPSKVYFPEPGWTKLDLAHYYATCAETTVRGLYDRPTVLKRWKDGIEGEVFFQKRVPEKRPEWLQTATVTFPSGRSATELVPNDAAHLVWAVNLGDIDWNPWPVRRGDLDHPDELRATSTHAGRRLERGARGRPVRRRRAARARPRGLPEDQRVARHPRQRLSASARARIAACERARAVLAR